MGPFVAPPAASRLAGASRATDAVPPLTGLPIGAVLDGRYELTARIADGGGGTVYEGRDRVLRRRVAVKVRRESDLDHGDRFEQEARLMAGLCHPGLVTVFDAGTDDRVGDTPQAYLVLEYVDGRTLAERLDRGPLSSEETARLGTQLASALACVHSRGIVHRDVKPANVLLTTAPDEDLPVAKLTDFGVARSLDGHGLTAHGQTVGTANYLSPEQAVGAESGPETDVYALGLLLLECLTGFIVFPGSGLVAAAARLHNPVSIPESIDPAWRALLAAMTDADPARRPVASYVAASLAKFPSMPMVRVAPGDTAILPPIAAAYAPASAGPATGSSARRKRRWALAGLSAAAATAAIWIAFALGPSTSAGVPSSGPASGAARPAAVTTQPAAAHTAPAAVHTTPSRAAPPQQPQPAPTQPKPPKPHHKGGG